MTWGKAAPILIVGALFDATRFFFMQFWFFGPASLAALCTIYLKDFAAAFTGGLFGTWATGAACSAASLTLGGIAFPALETFGIVMATALGFMGWAIVFMWMGITNRRIVTENPRSFAWALGSFVVSETPFVNMLPALFTTLARLHYVQIKRDRALHESWEKQVAEIRARGLAEAKERALALAAANEQRAQAETAAQASEGEAREPEAANDPSFRASPSRRSLTAEEEADVEREMEAMVARQMGPRAAAQMIAGYRQSKPLFEQARRQTERITGQDALRPQEFKKAA